MSHQRSAILLVVLGVIMIYLWYESTLLIKPKKNYTSTEKPIESVKTRRLLSVDDDPKQELEKGLPKAQKSKSFTSLSKGTISEDEIFNWEISFNVNKLKEESSNSNLLKSTESHKKKPKDDLMYLKVYANGSKQSYKEFHNSWSSVDQFVKNLFLKINPNNLATKQPVNFISEENDITTKLPPQSMKRKEGKFLSSIFNFGGGSNNKENPDIELGDDDALQNKTVTEMMHDITFVNITDDGENELIETSSVHQDTKKQDLSFETSEFDSHIFNTVQSNDVTHCQNCTLEMPLLSTISNPDESNLTVSKKLNSSDTIFEGRVKFVEDICRNFFNNLRKSDFIEFAGADNETALAEKIKENKKSDQLTAQTEFPESPEGVLRTIWKRLTHIRFVSGRKILQNASNMTEISIEIEKKESINKISGKTNSDSESFVFPIGFSIEQCENFFINESSLNQSNPNLLKELLESSNTEASSFFTDTVFNVNSENKDSSKFNENPSNLKKLDFKPEEISDVFKLLSTSNTTNNLEIAAFTEANTGIVTKNVVVDYDIPENVLDTFSVNTGTIHLNEESDVNAFSTLFENEDGILNKTGRGVNELRKDEFLEIGSGEESRIFSFFGSGGRELSENEQTTLTQNSQERIFIPDIFNFGSGSREIDDVLEKELILNPTTESKHSERFFGFAFGSGERMIPDTTFDSQNSITEAAIIQLSKSEMVTLENKFKTYEDSDVNKRELGQTILLDSTHTRKDTPQTIDEYLISPVPSVPATECVDCEKIAQPFISPRGQDKKPQNFTQLTEHKITVCQDCELKSDNNATIKDDFSVISKPVVTNKLKSPRRLSDFEDPFCPDCEFVEQNKFHQLTEVPLNSNIIPLENSASIEEIKLTNTRLETLENTVSTINPLTGDNVNAKDTDNVNKSALVIPSNNQDKPSQRPQIKNRRGGRADDLDDDWSMWAIQNKITPSIPRTTMMPSEIEKRDVQNNERSTLVHDEKRFNEDPVKTNENSLNLEDIEVSHLTLSEKLNTESTPLLSTSENLFKNFLTVSPNNSQLHTFSFVPNLTSNDSVSHAINYQDAKGMINPKIKTFPKFCQSARECNNTLGERCFSKDFGSVCDCARGFVRNPETRKCEAPVIMRTSMWMPKERFHKDLYDQQSKIYQRKREESLKTMWLLLQNNPELFLSVAELDVKGYEAGSLIVIWNMKVVIGENETVSELVNKFEENLKDIVKNNVIENIPLNIQNASAFVAAMNPCLQKEMNYCHEKAECNFNDLDGLSCMCKEGYQDNSKLNGEECVASCTSDYCGDHGECKLKNTGERHCLCSGWYIGWKCEISGIIVLCSFSAANVVIIIIVLMFICVFKRRTRNNDFYGGNVENFQADNVFHHNPRVMDIIALDNVAVSKGSKFVTVSTPNLEQPPVIEITSPSFPGSSIDYDSTFDRSRYSEQNYEYDITKKI